MNTFPFHTSLQFTLVWNNVKYKHLPNDCYYFISACSWMQIQTHQHVVAGELIEAHTVHWVQAERDPGHKFLHVINQQMVLPIRDQNKIKRKERSDCYLDSTADKHNDIIKMRMLLLICACVYSTGRMPEHSQSEQPSVLKCTDEKSYSAMTLCCQNDFLQGSIYA